MSEPYLDILRCPHCVKMGKGALERRDKDMLICVETNCGRGYPIVDGIPVMVTEDGDFLGYRKEVMVEIEARKADG